MSDIDTYGETPSELLGYRQYLLRLEQRMYEVERCISKYNRGTTTTGNTATDFDFCFLQFRYITELLTFALVEIHGLFDYAIPKSLIN